MKRTNCAATWLNACSNISAIARRRPSSANARFSAATCLRRPAKPARARRRRCPVCGFNFRPGAGDGRGAQAAVRPDPADDRIARHSGGAMYSADSRCAGRRRAGAFAALFETLEDRGPGDRDFYRVARTDPAGCRARLAGRARRRDLPGPWRAFRATAEPRAALARASEVPVGPAGKNSSEDEPRP